MKKSIITILLTAMVISSVGCGASGNTSVAGTASSESAASANGAASSENSASDTSTSENSAFIENISEKDITAEYLTLATTPSEIVKAGAFSVNKHYENTGDAMLEGSDIKSIFAKNGDACEVSELATYADGYVSNSYFTTSKDDTNYYMSYPGGAEASAMDAGYADEYTGNSLLGYGTDSLTINEVKESGDLITAKVTNLFNENVISNDTIAIDKTTGRITKIITSYASAKSAEDSTCTLDFDYSDGISVDYTAKYEVTGETAPAGSTAASDSTSAGDSAGDSASDNTASGEYSGELDLNTEDVNGNPVNSDLIKGAKLVLLNFWEPWCGPCVGEMPDLQKLYENYKDKGLVIIGAYQTFDMQSEAEEIVSSKGITYPIIKNNGYLAGLEQDYVPASYLVDGNGNLISDEPIAGARSYEDWEEIIKQYLE